MSFGCVTVEETVVDYDYSYYGRFDKYKTFDFLETQNIGTTQLHSELIKRSITKRLQSQGYRVASKRPGILISYKLFYNDLMMHSYSQPSFDYWLTSRKGADYLLDPETEEELKEEEEELRKASKEYDPIKCELKEGSLFISFFDRKRKKVIWQGFASGVFGNEQFDNERFVARTVGKILDQYRILAEGFGETDSD